ncbi:MAG: stage V sporulation protein AD [Clostridia bacterium]|jgi:stage V sporulation protein AD|nr:stage V sporulation protein AD [Clostridia bacterium]MCI2000306.1 stage V sporulation protein AD [Clostridia bacterium]MCI2015486.1 stage V sporulation protein AD [Clostridia bacterium]
MLKKKGRSTAVFDNVNVISSASFGGKKESEGPLGKYIDFTTEDAMYGEKSWEKAEIKFFREASKLAITKADISQSDVDYAFAGDLLNQCGASAYGMRDLDIPFFGIYGACSTFGESLSLGAMAIDGKFAENVLCTAGSHFCAAEKQFRFPLELGTQRPPSATWTVTGAGSCILSSNGNGPRITEVTTGKVVDMGVKDAANMGAAMAPAAAEAIYSHFLDTGRKTNYYDCVATGDLGEVGRELLKHLLAEKGLYFENNLTDCGIEMFDKESQDTHCGGSGCACSAVAFCAYFYKMLCEGKIKKMLLIPTGALMNTTASQQGESIPSIAHAIAFEARC